MPASFPRHTEIKDVLAFDKKLKETTFIVLIQIGYQNKIQGEKKRREKWWFNYPTDQSALPSCREEGQREIGMGELEASDFELGFGGGGRGVEGECYSIWVQLPICEENTS